jgi:CRP-like cAMP-binding protein
MMTDLRNEGSRACNSATRLPRRPSLDDLRRISIFAKLTTADLATIAALASVRRVQHGEEVSTRRAGASVVCFPLDAQFRLIITAPTGRQVILRSVPSGDFFGEDCSIGGIDQSDAIAVAECSGEYVELAGVHLRQLVEEIHDLCFALLEATALRSAALLDRVFELSVLELRYRLLAEILRLSRSGKSEADSVVISPAPTHEQFASIVGGTREGVTRELRALAHKGLIEVQRRKIRVPNIDHLKAQLAARSGGRPLLSIQRHAKVRIRQQ